MPVGDHHGVQLRRAAGILALFADIQGDVEHVLGVRILGRGAAAEIDQHAPVESGVVKREKKAVAEADVVGPQRQSSSGAGDGWDADFFGMLKHLLDRLLFLGAHGGPVHGCTGALDLAPTRHASAMHGGEAAELGGAGRELTGLPEVAQPLGLPFPR